MWLNIVKQVQIESNTKSKIIIINIVTYKTVNNSYVIFTFLMFIYYNYFNN